MESKTQFTQKGRSRRAKPNKNRARQTSRRMAGNQPLPYRQPAYAMANYIGRHPAMGYRYRKMIRYHEHVDLGTQNNATQGYVFAANGCYDPNITGTGHQPDGFDNLMLFFNHYQVISSTITVELSNEINQSLGALSFALAVQRNTTVLTWSRLLEGGGVAHLIYPSAPEGAGPVPPFVCNGVNIASFQSLPDIMNDDTTKGTASANPATLIYYVLYTVCQDFGGTPTTGGVHADVIIDYDTIFTEPLQIAQS